MKLATVVLTLIGLLILALGFYIAKRYFNLANLSPAKKSRRIYQITCLAIISLFATVALQKVTNSSYIPNNPPQPVSLANAFKYQKKVVLGTTSVSIGGGGYVTGIYFHPRQKDLVYIKTDVGGFYRWNSVNKSWIPITDHFPLSQSNYYGGEAFVLDPNNPNIIYIAAGKYTADWSPHKGNIFKSTNQGKTWTKLNLALKMGGNEDLRWTGERLAVNPFNSQNIFFGSRQDGLWSSTDGGKTWKQVTSFPGKSKENIGINAIAFNKQVSGKVYAISYGDGIYESNDTGNTWNKIPESPSEANRIVITNKDVLYVTHKSGVKKYVKGAWNDITPWNNQAEFNAIAVNPNNPQDLLVSTYAVTNTQIYRSLDGGSKWEKVERKVNTTVPWWSEYMLSKPSIAALEFDPLVSDRVWLTDWYGIWRTENINANPSVWTNHQQGHEELVTFTLVSPPKGALLLSGVADVDGFIHNQGLDTYPSRMFSATGPAFQDTYSIAYCEIDPLKMVRVGGNRFNDTFSGATSSDGGRSWKQFGSFPEKTLPTRVAISSTNPRLLLVTTSQGQPLRSTDGGLSWQSVSGLPNGFSGPWNWVQPLATDTVEGNTFYYYDQGKVYRSTDGAASFEEMSASVPKANWYALKAIPGVKGELWLGLDDQGLYHSTNGGESFSPIPGVEKAYLFAFGKAPPLSKVPALYLYGKIARQGEGIFRSLDKGKTWKRIGDRTRPIGNDPNVMEASKQQFGLVFIGTGGRGIYYGSE
ncbi:MAG: hypothetical protein VKL59_04915 [Nostocaceae cyanobacterium]|nr:hypothetical protein [Nostocaceae cyanobacterium]